MAGNNRVPGRSVISKIAAVLRSFEQARHPQTLGDIAAAADLPLSSAHRIVTEMVDEELLSRMSDGRYTVNLRMWSLSQSVGQQIRAAAHPFVQDLYSLTRHTSHLAVRYGRDSLYVIRLYGSQRVPRTSWAGSRQPLHSTAVGKVLLAYSSTWMWDAYIDGGLESFTPMTVQQPEQFKEELRTVRRLGYATTHQEQRMGTASIAVPVFHQGDIGASIGIVAPADVHRELRRHVPAMQQLALKIEAATNHIPMDTLISFYPDGPGASEEGLGGGSERRNRSSDYPY